VNFQRREATGGESYGSKRNTNRRNPTLGGERNQTIEGGRTIVVEGGEKNTDVQSVRDHTGKRAKFRGKEVCHVHRTQEEKKTAQRETWA